MSCNRQSVRTTPVKYPLWAYYKLPRYYRTIIRNEYESFLLYNPAISFQDFFVSQRDYYLNK